MVPGSISHLLAAAEYQKLYPLYPKWGRESPSCSSPQSWRHYGLAWPSYEASEWHQEVSRGNQEVAVPALILEFSGKKYEVSKKWTQQQQIGWAEEAGTFCTIPADCLNVPTPLYSVNRVARWGKVHFGSTLIYSSSFFSHSVSHILRYKQSPSLTILENHPHWIITPAQCPSIVSIFTVWNLSDEDWLHPSTPEFILPLWCSCWEVWKVSCSSLFHIFLLGFNVWAQYEAWQKESTIPAGFPQEKSTWSSKTFLVIISSFLFLTDQFVPLY